MQKRYKYIKIIYLVSSNLTERWESYFCLDELCQIFDIEYWNCRDIGYPQFDATQTMERSYVVQIHSIEDLISNLKRLPPNAILVPIPHFSEINFEMYDLISRYIHHYVGIDVFTYSLWSVLGSSKKTIKQRLYRFDLIRILAKKIKYGLRYDFRDAIQPKHCDSFNVDWVTKISKLFLTQYVMDNTIHQPYYINHPDYEKYLCLRNIVDRDDKYVVYVDQFYPFHADARLRLANVDVEEIASAFYTSINKFFDLIEAQMHCKVIIAAHPVADYNLKNPFNNREIVYFKTAELIRDSMAVCMHSSNAFSFVALFDKPAIIIDYGTKGIDMDTKLVREFANLLGVKLCNINEISTMANRFKFIDRKIRKKFIDKIADTEIDVHNNELYVRNFVKIFDEINNKK